MIDKLTEPLAFPAWELARKTKVFNKPELSCLAEDLRDSLEELSTDYTFVFMEPEDTIAGFINFGPAPITRGSWFIYWLAVDKNRQGEGIGQKLIAYAESVVKKNNGRLIYIETSSGLSKFEPARKAYKKAGYVQLVHFEDYYKNGDGKYVFCKDLRKKK